MDFLAKFAEADTASDAARKLKEECTGFPVRQLLYFASPAFGAEETAKAVKDAFPGAVTLGCTCYDCMQALNGSNRAIAAMAFGPEAFSRFAVTVAENIEQDPLAMEKALLRLQDEIGETIADLDYRSWFGMVIFDGRASNTESFVASAGNRTDITFVGGYASDFLTFKDIAVYRDDTAHRGAALVAIAKPKGKFALLKTQSAAIGARTFMVTGSDEKKKILKTLDGRPAMDVYAEALGMKPADIDAAVFRNNPFGVMAVGEPFIRAISVATGDGGLRLFCSLKEGVPVTLLKTTDIIEETARALEEKRRQLGGSIKAAVVFDCVLRNIEIHEENKFESYAGLFNGIQSIAFSTFGEAYIGLVTQTAVMILFG